MENSKRETNGDFLGNILLDSIDHVTSPGLSYVMNTHAKVVASC